MKVLITGGTGQIGEALLGRIDAIMPKGEGIDLSLLRHNNPLLIGRVGLSKFIERVTIVDSVFEHFDLTIHLAAIINTPFCQKPENRDVVIATNFGLTQNICAHSDFVIMTSSDNVFRGNKGREHEYKEDEKPDPCNFYGKTKWEAEHVVLASGGAVIRIQTMLGCRNIITQAAIDTVRGKPHHAFWNDTFSRPSYMFDFIRVLRAIIARREKGIYHCSTEGEIFSRARIAKTVLQFFRDNNLPHAIDAIPEEACSVPSFPRSLILSTEATRKKLDLSFTPSSKALNKHLKTLLLK
jgi:dTDP-4-dehydrorhamnose reductase